MSKIGLLHGTNIMSVLKGSVCFTKRFEIVTREQRSKRASKMRLLGYHKHHHHTVLCGRCGVNILYVVPIRLVHVVSTAHYIHFSRVFTRGPGKARVVPAARESMHASSQLWKHYHCCTLCITHPSCIIAPPWQKCPLLAQR